MHIFDRVQKRRRFKFLKQQICGARKEARQHTAACSMCDWRDIRDDPRLKGIGPPPHIKFARVKAMTLRCVSIAAFKTPELSRHDRQFGRRDHI